jgi:glycosyltransferase involved in cell wall biosynthesis
MRNDHKIGPLVSVIIPVFNASGHVVSALRSVFAQTFTDYEVILINDGSSDSGLLERAIQPYFSRIIYLKQENRGPSAARNLGIREAHGEWLAFLDSDDAWLPHYLAEQFRFLQCNPSLDMVYCDATLRGDTGAAGKTFMQLCQSSGPVTFESLLVEQTQPITSGTVIRRRSVTDAGLFDEEISCSEDHDLWLRVAYTGGKISYQRQALLLRNLRRGSQGSTPGRLFTGEIQSLKKLDKTLDLASSARTLLAARLRTIQAALAVIGGREFLLAGDSKRAYESLSYAQALAPTSRLRAALVSLRIAPRLTVWAVRVSRGRKFWQPSNDGANKPE